MSSKPRIRVTQYHPSFFEGFDDWTGEVETLEELLELDFIARWREAPEFYRYTLHRDYVTRDYFAPDDPPENIHLLLAELKEGRVWWVIAKLEGSDLEALKTLAEFAPPPKAE